MDKRLWVTNGHNCDINKLYTCNLILVEGKIRFPKGAFYCVQISIDPCMKDGSGLGGDGDDLELPGVENLLSNMETQTQDDLLLCINSCTQTGEQQFTQTGEQQFTQTGEKQLCSKRLTKAVHRQVSNSCALTGKKNTCSLLKKTDMHKHFKGTLSREFCFN